MTTTQCKTPVMLPPIKVGAEPLAVLAARTACALEQSIQRLVVAGDQNFAPWTEAGGQRADHRRRRGVDLAAGRRPLARRPPATGLLSHRATPGRRRAGALWLRQGPPRSLAQAAGPTTQAPIHRQSHPTTGSGLGHPAQRNGEGSHRQRSELFSRTPTPHGLSGRTARGRTHRQRPGGSHLPAGAMSVQTPGQFWSQAGDEALLCLETFWRNGRWHLLFPHTAFNPARN